MDLATEIRLMIFEEVFREVSGNVISHPLLHVCRTTRSEYIATFSGKISLYIAGWCTPFEDKKPKPTFTIRRSSDGEYVLPRRLNPRYNHPPACLSHIERVHTLRWSEDDFEAFANSPFSWWISHLHKVVFDPFILEYGDQESVENSSLLRSSARIDSYLWLWPEAKHSTLARILHPKIERFWCLLRLDWPSGKLYPKTRMTRRDFRRSLMPGYLTWWKRLLIMIS